MCLYPVHVLGMLIRLLLSHAKPFKCTVVPRSDKATQLILSVEDEHPFEAGDSDTLKAL